MILPSTSTLLQFTHARTPLQIMLSAFFPSYGVSDKTTPEIAQEHKETNYRYVDSKRKQDAIKRTQHASYQPTRFKQNINPLAATGSATPLSTGAQDTGYHFYGHVPRLDDSVVHSTKLNGDLFRFKKWDDQPYHDKTELDQGHVHLEILKEPPVQLPAHNISEYGPSFSCRVHATVSSTGTIHKLLINAAPGNLWNMRIHTHSTHLASSSTHASTLQEAMDLTLESIPCTAELQLPAPNGWIKHRHLPILNVWNDPHYDASTCFSVIELPRPIHVSCSQMITIDFASANAPLTRKFQVHLIEPFGYADVFRGRSTPSMLCMFLDRRNDLLGMYTGPLFQAVPTYPLSLYMYNVAVLKRSHPSDAGARALVMMPPYETIGSSRYHTRIDADLYHGINEAVTKKNLDAVDFPLAFMLLQQIASKQLEFKYPEKPYSGQGHSYRKVVARVMNAEDLSANAADTSCSSCPSQKKMMKQSHTPHPDSHPGMADQARQTEYRLQQIRRQHDLKIASAVSLPGPLIPSIAADTTRSVYLSDSSHPSGIPPPNERVAFVQSGSTGPEATRHKIKTRLIKHALKNQTANPATSSTSSTSANPDKHANQSAHISYAPRSSRCTIM